jgi:hypothetical protein
MAKFLGVDELSLLLAAGMLVVLRGGFSQPGAGASRIRPLLILTVVVCGLLALIHFASGIMLSSPLKEASNTLDVISQSYGTVCLGKGFMQLCEVFGEQIGSYTAFAKYVGHLLRTLFAILPMPFAHFPALD